MGLGLSINWMWNFVASGIYYAFSFQQPFITQMEWMSRHPCYLIAVDGFLKLYQEFSLLSFFLTFNSFWWCYENFTVTLKCECRIPLKTSAVQHLLNVIDSHAWNPISNSIEDWCCMVWTIRYATCAEQAVSKSYDEICCLAPVWILNSGRTKLVTLGILWLLITWQCKEPGHHQSWYWLCMINKSCESIGC